MYMETAEVFEINGVEYTVEVGQDDEPVRGSFGSGDDAQDREQEDYILRRLSLGDVWAWAYVRVTASAFGFRGADAVGACSYEGYQDFRRGGYFEDLIEGARADLVRAVHEAQADCARAIKAGLIAVDE